MNAVHRLAHFFFDEAHIQLGSDVLLDCTADSLATRGVNTGVECIRVYLSQSGADPYSNKHRIAVETFEDVALTVNLACIDFIEERH